MIRLKGPRACLITLTFLVASAGSAQNPPSTYAVAEKDADALYHTACVIPMGRTLDVPDVPARIASLDWEGRLSATLPLSLVSIPATHDAGTALGRTGWTRCQSLKIPAQLRLGVRGFDIRLRLVGSELGIYHGEESQNLRFLEVMNAFKSFLTSHPQEFLVMRVREESEALHPIGTFLKTFSAIQNGDTYGSLFFRATSRTQIPTVGQARGKIVLLDNFGSLQDAIAYPNVAMGVQDDYDTSDMQKKYDEIVAKFNDALNEKTGSTWHVNYISSSTVLVDQLNSALAQNARLDAFLWGKKGHLGLVFMNFPGVPLIKKIIASNF